MALFLQNKKLLQKLQRRVKRPNNVRMHSRALFPLPRIRHKMLSLQLQNLRPLQIRILLGHIKRLHELDSPLKNPSLLNTLRPKVPSKKRKIKSLTSGHQTTTSQFSKRCQ